MPKKKDKPVEVLDAAHKIWLAGLGGLAAAEEGGGRLFKSLVSRGTEYEQRLKQPLESAGDRIRGGVKQAKTHAGKALESIESAFDDRVASALHRLGVPTYDEVARLTRRVEDLTRAVQGKQPKAAARKKKAPKKAPARKKATAKKSKKKTTR